LRHSPLLKPNLVAIIAFDNCESYSRKLKMTWLGHRLRIDFKLMVAINQSCKRANSEARTRPEPDIYFSSPIWPESQM